MVSRLARPVYQQIRLRRRLDFNAAVPPAPFRRKTFCQRLIQRFRHFSRGSPQPNDVIPSFPWLPSVELIVQAESAVRVFQYFAVINDNLNPLRQIKKNVRVNGYWP